MKGMNIESFRWAQCAMLAGWRNSNPSLRYTTSLNEAHTFSFTFLCSCVDVCPRFSLFLRLLYWNLAQPYKHSVARSSSSNVENILKKTSLPSLNTILWEERFWYGCHQKVCPSFNFTGKPYPGVCGVVFFPTIITTLLLPFYVRLPMSFFLSGRMRMSYHEENAGRLLLQRCIERERVNKSDGKVRGRAR